MISRGSASVHLSEISISKSSASEDVAEDWHCDDAIFVQDALPGLFSSFCQGEDAKASEIAGEILEGLAEDEDSREVLASLQRSVS